MATERLSLLVVLFLSAVCAFAFQGSRGLYDDTEGRYAEITREMLATGNYLEPTLDHHPHWTKPPLTYWAIAGGIRTLGQNAWGVRLINSVAFIITVLAVAACAGVLWNPATGFAAGLVYLSSFFPVIGASVATPDTLLVMWETLAVLCYIKAYRARSRKAPRAWVRAMWVAFGLAFFTKGPPALVPCIALIVFHLYAGRPFVLFDLAGLLAFAVIGFWWFVMVSVPRPGLFDYFLEKEVGARIFSAQFKRNPQWYAPFYIYLPVLLAGQGLWLYYGFRVIMMEKLYRPGTYRRLLRSQRAPAVLVLLWFVIPLAVFWLSRSRLQLYVLPLFAPMALVTARHILKVHGSAAGMRRALRIALISVVVILLVKGIAPHVPLHQDTGRLYDAARSAAGGSAAYAVFEENDLYALDFYTNGTTRRVSALPGEPWADIDIQSLIAEIQDEPPSTSYVIISSEEHAVILEHTLSSAGLAYKQSGESGWRIFVVEPG